MIMRIEDVLGASPKTGCPVRSWWDEPKGGVSTLFVVAWEPAGMAPSTFLLLSQEAWEGEDWGVIIFVQALVL